MPDPRRLPNQPTRYTNVLRTPILIAFIALYFLWFAAAGLSTGFAPDDMHNMHKYWEAGPAAVAKANLTFCSSFYRPAGGAWYLALYSLVHMDPLAYRVTCFALLALNVWLLYRLTLAFTGSPHIAALATALGAFHAAMLPIYFSNSTIYDILCFTFYNAALIWYLESTLHAAEPLSGWRVAVFLILYIAALNAKEMAVTLPVFVFIYEWSHRRRTFRDLAPALIAGALTAIYIYGKTTGPDPLSALDAYKPIFTVQRFFATARNDMNLLFYTERWFNSTRVILLWIAMPAVALLLRSRTLALAATFAILAFLPVSFLPPREGFVCYLPLEWWSIYAAILMMELRQRYTPRIPALAVAIVIPLLLAPVHQYRKTHPLGLLINAQAATNNALADLRQLQLRLPPGGRVLVRKNRFGQDWDMYFLMKLWFNDHRIQIVLQDPHAEPRGDSAREYDLILDDQSGHLLVDQTASRQP